MTTKERVEKLCRLLLAGIPKLEVKVLANPRPAGDWFIDTTFGDRFDAIAFRPSKGYGMSSLPTEGIGEGPDEIFATEEEVVARLAELIRTGKRTQSAYQQVRTVHQVRERRQVSQLALATKLKVRQPTISKMERRDDMSVSTLRRYVHALGGTLRVQAQFPEGAIEILGGENVTARPRRRKRRATMKK